MHAACPNSIVIGHARLDGHPTRDARAEYAGRARAREVGLAEHAVVSQHGSAGPRRGAQPGASWAVLRTLRRTRHQLVRVNLLIFVWRK